MVESSPNDKKTLWEKEKLLITSNFSFSHSVFKRLVLQTHKNQGLFGKGLTAKLIPWRSVTNRFPGFSQTSTDTTFPSKATDYFSYMLLQR